MGERGFDRPNLTLMVTGCQGADVYFAVSCNSIIDNSCEGFVVYKSKYVGKGLLKKELL